MSDQTLGPQVIAVLFTILGQEGKFPINVARKGVYFFPEDKLSVKYIDNPVKSHVTSCTIDLIISSQIILKKAFVAQSNTDGIQKQLDEFTNFIDVAYYVWIITPKLLQKVSKPSEKFISRVLEVLQQIPIPSEEELNYQNNEVLLCYTKSENFDSSCVKMDWDRMQNCDSIRRQSKIQTEIFRFARIHPKFMEYNSQLEVRE